MKQNVFARLTRRRAERNQGAGRVRPVVPVATQRGGEPREHEERPHVREAKEEGRRQPEPPPEQRKEQAPLDRAM